MDKELFRKKEGNLYGYYKDKDRLEKVRAEIEIVNNSIKSIDKRIKSCNVNIDPYQYGVAVSERVQSSTSTSSYVEKELIKAIDNMAKKKGQRVAGLNELLDEEDDLIYRMGNMEKNMGNLGEKAKRFIELKYKDNLPVEIIAFEMYTAKSSLYDFRNELIENISNYSKWLLNSWNNFGISLEHLRENKIYNNIVENMDRVFHCG